MSNFDPYTNRRTLPPLAALRAFEAAARLLSFKRAAAELGVTPTAISHQIRQLEDGLGRPLFVRRTRRVELTDAGTRLLPFLTEGLDQMQRGIDELRSDAAERAVTVTATVAFTTRWLVPRLSRFRTRHPDVRLRFLASNDLIDPIGNAADLAIRYGGQRVAGSRSTQLFRARFAAVCRPGLGVRGPTDVIRGPLIRFAWHRSTPDTPTWSRWFQAAGLDRGTPSVDDEARSDLDFSEEGDALLAAVAGEGIALANLALVADDLERGDLTVPCGPVMDGDWFRLIAPIRPDSGRAVGSGQSEAWIIEEAGRFAERLGALIPRATVG